VVKSKTIFLETNPKQIKIAACEHRKENSASDIVKKLLLGKL